MYTVTIKACASLVYVYESINETGTDSFSSNVTTGTMPAMADVWRGKKTSRRRTNIQDSPLSASIFTETFAQVNFTH